jgi:predicted DNA-binding transcriptional regulator AlpA
MMLKPKSIAEKIGVTTQTLMSWRKKGTGPKWIKLSRYIIRYPEEDFNSWLENEHNKSSQQTNSSSE